MTGSGPGAGGRASGGSSAPGDAGSSTGHPGGTAGEASAEEEDLPRSGDDELTPNTGCAMEVEAKVASKIVTVVVVQVSTDLGALDGGYIEFGTTEQYGQRAPLNLGAGRRRTLLLGLPPETNVHYRVLAKSKGRICASDDRTLATLRAPSAVPLPSLSPNERAHLSPGFLVTSMTAIHDGRSSSYVLIYNDEGSPVWWYESPIGDVGRAALSLDSEWMYIRDANPSGEPGGKAARIAMDGSELQLLDVPRGHHDLCIAPGGVIFLSGGGTDACGEIIQLSSDGSQSTLYDIRQAFTGAFEGGGGDPCHCNSVHYNAADNSLTVSCLQQNAFFKISMAGELLWTLGGHGMQPHFTGDVHWNRQHGHHMVTPTRLVFFNNNGLGDGNDQSEDDALVVDLDLNLRNMVATRRRSYRGGYNSITYGDAQMLENGHLLVTYSNDGVIVEVDGNNEAVAHWAFHGSLGYALHRPTLYGEPPRF